MMAECDRDAIELETEILAARWDLDSDRVIKVFCRLADEGWTGPDFPNFTPQEIAIETVSPQPVLHHFETV